MDSSCLSAVNIKYLVTARKLCNSEYGVKSTDIAKELKVSRPSVTAMAKTLSCRGVVQKDRYRKLYLTGSGVELADLYTSCHDTLRARFDTTFGDGQISEDAIYAFMARMPKEKLINICSVNSREDTIR